MTSNPLIAPIWTIRSLLQWSGAWLAERGFETPRLDAELLLAHALGLERLGLFLDPDRPLIPEELAAFKQRLQRRANHEPVAYILGRRDFWKDTFLVNPHVLIPRPETELLVEVVRRHFPDRGAEWHFLEMGCGSGAPILSLLREFPQARGVGVDIRVEALGVSRANGEALGMEARVQWLEGDLTQPLATASLFDAVISNPPYIAGAVWAELPLDVRKFEPSVALYGGEEGVDVLRRLIPGVVPFTRPGGLLATEIGYDQSQVVQGFFHQAGWVDVDVVEDLNRHPRVVYGKNGSPK